MSMDINNQDRQENELTALKAIYAEDLKDLSKKGASGSSSSSSNKWTPLDLSITLTPQEGASSDGNIYVQVDFRVICSIKYPAAEPPKISFENVKGISQADIKKLKTRVDNEKVKYKNEEMILQLCLCVREFLYEHNKPGMKSLYDEMLRNQQEVQLQAKRGEQLEVAKKKETLMKEVEERTELLKTEAKLQRKSAMKQQQQQHNDQNEEADFPKLKEDKRRVKICSHLSQLQLNFRTAVIERLQCLKHPNQHQIIFSAFNKNTGVLVEVVQFNVPFFNDKVLKLINNIEQELIMLNKLKDSHLVRYMDMKFDVLHDEVIIYILKELCPGSDCKSFFIDNKLKIDIPQLKYVAKNVLSTLDFLHMNNIVHKEIKEEFIIINDKGVKVTDYSITRKLLDLIQSVSGTYSKKNDIVDFGHFMLRLLGENWDGKDKLNITNRFPDDLCDFIQNCLIYERPTANKLCQHPFLLESIPDLVPLEINLPAVIDALKVEEEDVPKAMTVVGENQSRIKDDYQILRVIGQGAFGKVLMVKNKLDAGVYAIKKIELTNKGLNKKKIINEVKLLSQLNHENIVRYHNSWVETTTLKKTEDNIPEEAAAAAEAAEAVASAAEENDLESMALGNNDNVIEVAVTYDGKTSYTDGDYSNDDEEEEEEETSEDESSKNLYIAPSNRNDESDSILFEAESNYRQENNSDKHIAVSKTTPEQTSNKKCTEAVRKVDHLYIQMEYCEKSTLRNAIDGELYLNLDRVKRLFKEIVEGLAYLHKQGIIHRDLKPVNIFLDSQDRVKIGDFGLATSTVVCTSASIPTKFNGSEGGGVGSEISEEGKTGRVGTALYIAPEVNSAVKVKYKQEIDIYSLGITLFEMCYRPLFTTMERVLILTDLRTEDILIPADFPIENNCAVDLIQSLLSHDISKRPTAQKLLKSKFLPPPVVEERKIRDIVAHTLENPQLKVYRYLIDSCFKQNITLAQDVTYDRDPVSLIQAKPLAVFEHVREICTKICCEHGAFSMSTPLLIPRSKFYEKTASCVNVMTHFGNVVSLPNDLRVPFARYLAWNKIASIRRYCISRIYKEKKVFGFIPREFYQCAFDIVTPKKNLIFDAEILYVVYRIIKELPGIKSKAVTIRLNHTDLFEAVILHFGLETKKDDILKILMDIKEGQTTKNEIQRFLSQRGNLSDSNINLMLTFLFNDVEIPRADASIQFITNKKKGKSKASELAKTALKELKTIVDNAIVYGVELEILIAPGMTSNIREYSGMFCQFETSEERKKKKLAINEVIAAGGRYDGMIAYYRNMMEQTNMITTNEKDTAQFAVGVSIFIDKLVQAVQKNCKKTGRKLNSTDTVVCSVGSTNVDGDAVKIMKSLWASGITAFVVQVPSTAEIQDLVIEVGLLNAVVLKEQDHGNVHIWTWERDPSDSYDKFQDKVCSAIDFIENPLNFMKNDTRGGGGVGGIESIQSSSLMRTESNKSNNSSSFDNNDSSVAVDILFIADKLSANLRKQLQNKIRSQLDGLFKRLGGSISVIGVNIDKTTIKNIDYYLDFQSEAEFKSSVGKLVSKQSKAKYLIEITDEIWAIFIKKDPPVVILYSLIDNFYKVINLC